jgi:flavin reductase (DIM6/NTAB) family NADH-FMN oxidoreductase RutF
MKDQKEPFAAIPLAKAYGLIVPGRPILVASKGAHYNLAPIAWNCPLDYEPVTKLLFVCDPAHQTAHNIKKTGEFSVCVPESEDDPLIGKCGSVSDPNADKYARFGIDSLPGEKTDTRIPATAKAWIECKLIRVIEEGSVEIFLGEAVAAFAAIAKG